MSIHRRSGRPGAGGGWMAPLVVVAIVVVVAGAVACAYLLRGGEGGSAGRPGRDRAAPEGEAPGERPGSAMAGPAPRIDIPKRKPGARRDPVPGLYGEAEREPSRSIPSAVDNSVLESRPWEKKQFWFMQTALHPALFMRAKSDRLVFFHKLGGWGLGRPSFMVYKAGGGAASSRTTVDGAKMAAPWIIASFAGSEGWTDWDAPWLVVLQKRPAEIGLAADGLTILFEGTDTGHVMAMPLYGYYKPPQRGKEYLVAHGMPAVGGGSGVETWKWERALPAEVIALADWWAGTARAFPWTFEETFSVDRLLDTITFKQRHRYLENADDWGTKAIRFAAVPQTLALAVAHGGATKAFPVEFSEPLHDPKCMTAYGPFLGVVGKDEFTYTMPALKYVNEKEKHLPANMDDPVVAEAAERLRGEMSRKFRKADQPGPYDHGGMGNYCWCIMGDCWYAKVLPYVDEATRPFVASSLKRYFTDTVLNEATYDPHRHKLLLHGPGIGSWGTWGDAGKFSMNAIHTIWCYAHYTGDWDLVERNWGVVKRLFIHPEEMHWATVGRMAIAEMGDEAEPAMAYARIAWRLGDVDEYNYGCYVFAKELVHHYVKQVGAEYFRRHQPYHQMGFMPPKVWLTNMWGSTAGWQIDGIRWSYSGGEHQSTNRWVRFHSEDVGRFYRDVLAKEVRAELDDPETGKDRFGRHVRVDDSHILPSFVRVRSLVLNDSPEELAKWARPKDVGGPTSGVVASMFAYVRTGRPAEYERLVPASGGPSPFVHGRERETTESLSSLVLLNRGGTREWPLPTWHFWPPPRQPARHDSKGTRPFGFVTPFPGMKAVDGKTWPLDWAGGVTGLDAVEPRKIPNEQALRARQARMPFRIAGPFPNPGNAARKTVYPPERGIDLAATYAEAGGAGWKAVTATDGAVDLTKLLSPKENVCAYAVTAVKVPTARKSVLFIGSDDGVRVWLNGEIVHDNPVSRGLTPDQDLVPVELRAGWNRVLMKIDQGDGGWGLCLRVAHPDEGPFEDIEFSASPDVVEGSGK